MVQHREWLFVTAVIKASAFVLEVPVVISKPFASINVKFETHPETTAFCSILAYLLSESSIPTAQRILVRVGQHHRTLARITMPRHSPNARHLSSSSTIPYSGGQVAGGAYQGVFTVPGSEVEWNQTFMSANKSDWHFIAATAFLGLSSLQSLSKTPLIWSRSYYRTVHWMYRCSGLFYSTDHQNNGEQNGVFTIGGSHEDTYVDVETVYTPLIREDEYQLWYAPLRTVNVLVALEPSDANFTMETHYGSLPTTTVPEGSFPTNITWHLYSTGSAVFDTGADRLVVPSGLIDTMY